ncbi:DUF763 domain-containing protein [Candidatus Berkelbacteria bacterium]|nr:DUF763 domain-containing protein [Candidatus Berkelbacteria bacterium]
MRTGVATFGLDFGRCPPWLFQRMVRLARVVLIAIISEFGSREFLKRLSDPVWFQSLGCLLAFDWNASGLTTTTLGALKEALRGLEKDLDIFIAGGKGKTSRKTPEQIVQWGKILGFSENQVATLDYISRATAKVDSALIQDSFQIYHHNLIFNRQGQWTVVQQGMNIEKLLARRYHWHSGAISRIAASEAGMEQDRIDFINEPHSGIASQLKLNKVLNLTSKQSQKNRQTQVMLLERKKTLTHELAVLARLPTSDAVGSDGQGNKNQPTIFKTLKLSNQDFYTHPIVNVNFQSPRLLKNIQKLQILKPGNFQELLMVRGVGGVTLRSLSLVAEIIYGAKPSYEDPARYTFAHGGKDNVPFPVDRKTYDQSLGILERAILKSKLPFWEKDKALYRAERFFGKIKT